jgi:hypothetical protein
MKKVLVLLLVAISSMTVFGQTKQPTTTSKKFPVTCKVGLAMQLPADVYGKDYHLKIGSSVIEAATPLSKKFDLTLTTGYLKFNSNEDDKGFVQVPAMLGLRYPVCNYCYLGFATGVAFTNDSEMGTQIAYTPYIGVHGKKMSVDLRYFNHFKTFKNGPSTVKTVGMVVSYSL